MRCEIIAVGTELLMGQTLNTNARNIATELFALGVGVYYHTVVGDNEARLKEVFKNSLERVDLIILSGGLGPTDDDITRDIVAEVLELPLQRNEYWVKKMEEFFRRFKRPMTQINLRQAMVPKGGTLLPNDRGTAPGIYLEKGAQIIVLLPGPPRELAPMFKEQVIPRLQEKLGEQKDLGVLKSRVLRVVGLGESAMVEKIKPILDSQDNPTIAPLAKGAEVHLRLTARERSGERAETLLQEKLQEIREVLGDYIYGEGEETLEMAVTKLLRDKAKTIAAAESCSGGLLSSRFTDVPGSSACFLGGAVTYSNEAKSNLLGVEENLLNTVGAVSAEVASAMAGGARKLFKTDIGIGITGIAGPGGATPEKAVGLTFIALEADDCTLCRRYQFWGSRLEIKERVTQAALYLLRLYLLGKLQENDTRSGDENKVD